MNTMLISHLQRSSKNKNEIILEGFNSANCYGIVDIITLNYKYMTITYFTGGGQNGEIHDVGTFTDKDNVLTIKVNKDYYESSSEIISINYAIKNVDLNVFDGYCKVNYSRMIVLSKNPIFNDNVYCNNGTMIEMFNLACEQIKTTIREMNYDKLSGVTKCGERENETNLCVEFNIKQLKKVDDKMISFISDTIGKVCKCARVSFIPIHYSDTELIIYSIDHKKSNKRTDKPYIMINKKGVKYLTELDDEGIMCIQELTKHYKFE